MSQPTNLLLIMSDEHSRKVLGCYGNDIIKTPNLDRLAARGTLFSDGYTPSAICVPARAAFATGQYVHNTGHWSNATPYVGTEPSWGHVLQRRGHVVGSIGKLHYRNETDPTGFDFQQVPMHLVDGSGDVLGCVRDPLPKRVKNRNLAEKIGPGESGYTRYDREITEHVLAWLEERGKDGADAKPWTLFASLVCPHFPLISPEQFYAPYADLDLMPEKALPGDEHPWLALQRECFTYDNFTPERTQIALKSYYGMVSFMDWNVGRILDALDAAGLTDSTRIVYVSDHGENAGERDMWGKSNFYEEASGIPTIVAGPGVPAGRVSTTPTNLTDIFPTVLDAMGIAEDDGVDRPGQSLFELADAPDNPDRTIFSEYHAAGAPSGGFMIRKGHWKLAFYVGMAPVLYNLTDDPEELVDVAGDPRYADALDDLLQELHAICSPDEVDAACVRDHNAIIEAHGGRDAVVKKGGFGGTPAPGDKAIYAGT